MDDDYSDDHSHLIDPPPKPVTKKVRFADDMQPPVDPDPQPVPPVATSPTNDTQQEQPMLQKQDPSAVMPSPPKKPRLYKDVDDALGYRLGTQRVETIVTALRSSRGKIGRASCRER